MTPPSTGLSLDHPRIRGEHAGDDDATTELKGSSPHTRGALLPVSRGGSDSRIIPAYAGSTEYARSVPLSVPDHPRIRGEHVSLWDAMVRVSGSSPHTRGALLKIVNLTCREGIIPAYAGSTFWMLGFVLVVGDHPRIRGEHREYFAMWVLTHGSSPHTRGAPGRATSWPSPARDHPRIRGEHVVLRLVDLGREGSSPHTRGALLLLLPHPPQGGIIPAYAGSTPKEGEALWVLRDHPRIRGEHETKRREPVDGDGSSPHTRGALTVGEGVPEVLGIIPAYAGSTGPR